MGPPPGSLGITRVVVEGDEVVERSVLIVCWRRKFLAKSFGSERIGADGAPDPSGLLGVFGYAVRYDVRR
jgi:hypothetical protein